MAKQLDIVEGQLGYGAPTPPIAPTVKGVWGTGSQLGGNYYLGEEQEGEEVTFVITFVLVHQSALARAF